MKVFFRIVICVALCCGLVYVGYLIFGASVVKDIEIVGNVQQIYFSNDNVNFGDAKLRVTYQNGTQKTIGMKGNVSVSNFSTSGVGEKMDTMTIAYKSQSEKVDYVVLAKAAYEVTSEVASGVQIFSSKTKIIEFFDDGKLKYFVIENQKKYVHDGNYDDDYSYQIVGDKILVNLGEEKYEMFATTENNIIKVCATSKITTNNGTKIVETKFKRSDKIKTNNEKQEKTKLEIDHSKSTISINGNVWLIEKDTKIEDTGLCLRVDYDNGEVYYVYITTEMLLTKDFSDEYGEPFNIQGYYEQRLFAIVYKII